MSEDQNGKIEITIVDGEDGPTINFNTNMSLVDMNFWLDQVKHLIVSGEAQVTS